VEDPLPPHAAAADAHRLPLASPCDPPCPQPIANAPRLAPRVLDSPCPQPIAGHRLMLLTPLVAVSRSTAAQKMKRGILFFPLPLGPSHVPAANNPTDLVKTTTDDLEQIFNNSYNTPE